MEASAPVTRQLDPRWFFNFEDWQPSQAEWELCLSLVPADESERIRRFKRPTKDGVITGRHNANAKASLAGRLMLRKCASENLGLEPSKQLWRRTLEGKPFLLNTPMSSSTYTSAADGLSRAAYNMNLSHDGKLVTLVAGKDFVLGVDVMCNAPRDSSPVQEFFSYFEENFTASEWKAIKGQSSDTKMLHSFYHHWTLKESYIKSVGIGLGFELQRAEFTLDDNEAPTSATVAIDGQSEAKRWFFEVHRLGAQNHTISVAYGPLEHSVDSVKSCLGFPGPKKDCDPLSAPTRFEFRELTIKDLI